MNEHDYIANLTQHSSTSEQKDEGVYDLDPEQMTSLRELLTFATLPTPQEVRHRAGLIADIAKGVGASHAMIGGAPFLMRYLEAALINRGIAPLYAFSQRQSVEQIQTDGSVRKVNTFRHLGFVRV